MGEGGGEKLERGMGRVAVKLSFHFKKNLGGEPNKFQVGLLDPTSNSLICGGTLISNQVFKFNLNFFNNIFI